MTKKSIVAIATLSALASACHSAPPRVVAAYDDVRVEAGRTYRWSFDESPGTPGTGGPMIARHPRTFQSVLGRWRVEGDAQAASSPNVYRQGARLDVGETPRVVVSDLVFGDMSARVLCRPESGSVGESCGMMFAVAHAHDYLVVRADGIDQTIKLFHVANGAEEELASFGVVVDERWHALSVAVRGDVVDVAWDDVHAFTSRTNLELRGKIGLATRADSITAFDDLVVRSDG